MTDKKNTGIGSASKTFKDASSLLCEIKGLTITPTEYYKSIGSMNYVLGMVQDKGNTVTTVGIHTFMDEWDIQNHIKNGTDIKFDGTVKLYKSGSASTFLQGVDQRDMCDFDIRTKRKIQSGARVLYVMGDSKDTNCETCNCAAQKPQF